MDDAHFPDHRGNPRRPHDHTAHHRGSGVPGAHAWLLEAAEADTARMNVKMAEDEALAKIGGTARVDKALDQAATYGRFATGDHASLLSAGGVNADPKQGQ
ncbi:hypothetical protein E3T61_08760 [Cryobacterium lactosi]|uniref:Uncharacterized protein n=1 Tax=Cryobacterium lactosi TaxID=1259202 RepID=A0A4R9BXI0_9MICO|nr:hypothetical protein [Cryobacterium lactosi]TFD91546.1 hypothetical protein E3T61_08760 [Cryobacterium lactosi]